MNWLALLMILGGTALLLSSDPKGVPAENVKELILEAMTAIMGVTIAMSGLIVLALKEALK